MSPRWIVIVLFASVEILAASGPFDLRLSDLSSTWFRSGDLDAIIRVPADRCGELQVRLRRAPHQEIAVEDLALQLDGAYARASRATSLEDYLLTVHTREPLGLLTGPEHIIEAAANDGAHLRAKWTILRWDKPYLQSTVVGKSGIPVGLQMGQPIGGVFLSTGTVRVSGEVHGGVDSQLTIQGRAVPRIATKPGFQFDENVNIASDVSEVVINVTDGAQGGSTTLVLPVRPIAGR